MSEKDGPFTKSECAASGQTKSEPSLSIFMERRGGRLKGMDASRKAAGVGGVWAEDDACIWGHLVRSGKDGSSYLRRGVWMRSCDLTPQQTKIHAQPLYQIGNTGEQSRAGSLTKSP